MKRKNWAVTIPRKGTYVPLIVRPIKVPRHTRYTFSIRRPEAFTVYTHKDPTGGWFYLKRI